MYYNMIPIVVITTTIGIIAGITSIIHNLLQIKNTKSACAIKIQRAFRRHRTAKFSYGALKLEFTTENVPTIHHVEKEKMPPPCPPPRETKTKKRFFNLF